jgi:Holliday junction resolvasome RuvABC endonuclease subunit
MSSCIPEKQQKRRGIKMILVMDIAFKNLGWSVLHNGEIIEFGTIRTERTKKKNTLVSDDKASRAAYIASMLNQIIKKHEPKGIIGELPSGSKNAAASNLLGWAAGIVVGVAECHGLPCEWISEGDSKKAALGVRSAKKEASMAWATEAFPSTEFPDSKRHFEHVADALMAYNGLRSGLLVRTFG